MPPIAAPRGMIRRARSALEDDSLGELVGRLVADGKDLARAEIEVRTLAIRARVAAAKGPAAMIGLGVLLALASFGALLVGLAIALGQVIGMLGGALVVGLGGMALGGLLIWLAVRRLAALMSPKAVP